MASRGFAPLLAPLFDAVSFPEDRVVQLQELASKGTLVYIMRSAGALNYAYFAHAYAQRALPVPAVVHGLGVRLLPRAWGVRGARTEELVSAVGHGESALVFLRRPELFGPRRGASPEEDPFPALVKLARAGDHRLYLVPQVLVWERHPGRLRPGLPALLVGTPDSPSAWRTAGAFLYNFRHAFAKVGTPVDLNAFCKTEGDTPDAVVARKVRGALWQHLAHETRVVTGPRLKGTDRIVEEVLRDRALRRTLEQLSAEGGGKPETLPEALIAQAERDVKSIAASYSPTAVELFRPTLDVIFNRIYDGVEIDKDGLERIKGAAAKAPVILCPSHKSHIDYLILSKVLYDAGMNPPHIAAGENLSFFPLGPLFRRSGAFFLRRSFKGDRVYGAAFRAYIKRLMHDGFTQEFFIEGGRSRTGKLLSPKLGMLSMELDAWLEGASHDVIFIPIAIDYERIIEGGSYADEVAGGEKKKEDLSGLLRTPKVLASRYGRIYLQVEEPFSLRDFFAERRIDPAHHTEAERREVVQVLAHRIVYGIARAATITPAALVGAALLAHRRRGLSRVDVAARIDFLRRLCTRTGARLSRVLEEASSDPGVEGPIREAVLLLAKDGVIGELPASGEIYLVVKPERRLQLSFYKNNLIHPFVPLSLFSAGLLSFRTGAPTLDELRERVLWLSRLLKHEFVYRVGSTFAEIFEDTLKLARELGLVEKVGEQRVQSASIAARERLELLRDLTHDFVESYLLAADTVDELLRSDGPTAGTPAKGDGSEGIDQREMVKLAMERGQSAYLAGRIQGQESLSKLGFENAFRALGDAGLVELADKKIQVSSALRQNRQPLDRFKEELGWYV